MTQFESDFQKYTELIKSKKPFAYARYADGEVLLMKGETVGYNSQAYAVDRWSSLNRSVKVSEGLLESLKHEEENYHYAISSHSDSIDDYNYLKSKIKNSNITFANLWINSNYSKMKEFYKSLIDPVYVICNYRANSQVFPFPVIEMFPFPDDCVNYWENEGDTYLEQLLDYVVQVQKGTFFISAGPVSEILIDKMYTSNPDNQYIDVGSSMDEFIYGRKTRPYMEPGSYYATQVSSFAHD